MKIVHYLLIIKVTIHFKRVLISKKSLILALKYKTTTKIWSLEFQDSSIVVSWKNWWYRCKFIKDNPGFQKLEKYLRTFKEQYRAIDSKVMYFKTNII